MLRLGVVETIAHTWLPAVIKGFNAAHPGVTLELDVDTTVGLRAALVERRIDAAFLMGPVSEPSIDNRPLARYPLAWIASPGLDLPDRPLDPAEIARVPVVTYSRHSRPYLQIRGPARRRRRGTEAAAACLQLARHHRPADAETASASRRSPRASSPMSWTAARWSNSPARFPCPISISPPRGRTGPAIRRSTH